MFYFWILKDQLCVYPYFCNWIFWNNLSLSLKKPERIGKLKHKRNSSENKVDEPEQSSRRLEAESVISDRDFEELFNNVENSLLRVQDPEIRQKLLQNGNDKV